MAIVTIPSAWVCTKKITEIIARQIKVVKGR